MPPHPDNNSLSHINDQLSQTRPSTCPDNREYRVEFRRNAAACLQNCGHPLPADEILDALADSVKLHEDLYRLLAK